MVSTEINLYKEHDKPTSSSTTMDKLPRKKSTVVIPPRPKRQEYPHHDIINIFDKELFPYPQYEIVVFMSGPLPPHFYIYGEEAQVAVNMQTLEIDKIEGDNAESINYICSNLLLWLKQQSSWEGEDGTNSEVLRDAWFCFDEKDGHKIKFSDLK